MERLVPPHRGLSKMSWPCKVSRRWKPHDLKGIVVGRGEVPPPPTHTHTHTHTHKHKWKQHDEEKNSAKVAK